MPSVISYEMLRGRMYSLSPLIVVPLRSLPGCNLVSTILYLIVVSRLSLTLHRGFPRTVQQQLLTEIITFMFTDKIASNLISTQAINKCRKVLDKAKLHYCESTKSRISSLVRIIFPQLSCKCAPLNCRPYFRNYSTSASLILLSLPV